MYEEYKERMKKSLDFLNGQFGSVRAGRASASVLDKISMEYYGTQTPIGQIATIASPDPRTLTVQPWDTGVLSAIERAIQASDLGINPQNDGKILRLSFPQLTEERRRELVKQVKKYGEECKVAVRNVRRDAMEYFKAQKKKSEITEGDLKDIEKELQKITDEFIKDVDKMAEKKEKELSEL